LNVRDAGRCENPRRVVPAVPCGLPQGGRGGADADRYSGAPSLRCKAVATKRVRGGGAKFPSRRTWQALEGRNPREHPVAGVLNTCSCDLGLPEGAKPRNRALSSRPVPSGAGIPTWENGTWVLPAGNGPDTFREEKLRRVNPMSAAGVKQNRRGIARSKPPRG
jgi:hypothetical protein